MPDDVLIAGYFGFGNLGDEAILESLLMDLEPLAGNYNPVVLSGDPMRTKAQYLVEAIHWRDSTSVAHGMSKAAALIIGGGSLLHDYWQPKVSEVLTARQQGLSYYASLLAQARIFGLSTFGYGLGVGPLETSDGEVLAKAMVQQFQWLSVRDQYSIGELVRLGMDPETANIHLGSDLALRHPIYRQTTLTKPDEKDLILGVNLRYWDIGIDPLVASKILAETFDQWLSESSRQVVFFPFQTKPNTTYENDLAFIEKVVEEMACGSQTRIWNTQSLQDARGLLNEVNQVIATRYHAGLLAISHDIPTVVLAYDPKCDALADEFGLESLPLIQDQFSKDSLLGLLNVLQEEDKEGRGWVQSRIQNARDRGEAIAHQFIQAIEESNTNSKSKSDDELMEIIQTRLRQGGLAASWMEDYRSNADLSLGHLDRLSDELELRNHLDHLVDANKLLSEDLENKERDLSEKRRFIDELRQEFRKLERRYSELETEKINLEEEKWSLNELLNTTAETANAEVSKRILVENELLSIRSTLGFRLLAKYWQFIRNLIPVGSWRRRQYQRAAGALRKLTNAASPRRSLGRTGSSEVEPQEDWLEAHRAEFDCFAREQLHNASPAVLMVAPTEFNPNEGQRSVHLALQLAENNIPVLFSFWRWNVDVQPEDHNPHSMILQTPLDLLIEGPSGYLDQFNGADRWLILEFPDPELFSLISQAHAEGWIVIYDVVDDWKSFNKLGQAPWYQEAFEGHLANTVDMVLASSPHIKFMIEERWGIKPHLLPNAGSPVVSRPALPESKPGNDLVLGYFGNLSPAWFDWKLIKDVAKHHPEWRIELIGNPPEQISSDRPSNIRLLGEIPQTMLGEYAISWDVGIVPFRSGPLADAVDAIKIYEYLGLGLPVVTKGVRPPQGAEHLVIETINPEQFIQAIERARHQTTEFEARLEYAAANSWPQRADRLLELIEDGASRIKEKKALFSI